MWGYSYALCYQNGAKLKQNFDFCLKSKEMSAHTVHTFVLSLKYSAANYVTFNVNSIVKHYMGKLIKCYNLSIHFLSILEWPAPYHLND